MNPVVSDLTFTVGNVMFYFKIQVGGGGQMAADLMNQTITNIVFGGIIRILPRWRAVQYVSSNILKLNFQFESVKLYCCCFDFDKPKNILSCNLFLSIFEETLLY